MPPSKGPQGCIFIDDDTDVSRLFKEHAQVRFLRLPPPSASQQRDSAQPWSEDPRLRNYPTASVELFLRPLGVPLLSKSVVR